MPPFLSPDVALVDENDFAIVGRRNGRGTVLMMSAGHVVEDFGQSGFVEIDAEDTSTTATAVAFDAEGRLLVAGRRDGEIYVARYDSSGVLDLGFGNAGIAAASVDGETAQVRTMALGDDGRIIVVGDSGRVVVAFDINGQWDTSFGDDGIVNT